MKGFPVAATSRALFFLADRSFFDDLQRARPQKAQKLFVFAALTEWGQWNDAAGRKIREPC